jgi:hypothetical protein
LGRLWHLGRFWLWGDFDFGKIVAFRQILAFGKILAFGEILTWGDFDFPAADSLGCQSRSASQLAPRTARSVVFIYSITADCLYRDLLACS